MTLPINHKKRDEWVKHLRPLGKLFYRLNLISYDELFDDIDFNWKYWHVFEKIICHFRGHVQEQLYRFPLNVEYGIFEKCGLVKSNIICKRCWSTL